MSRFKEYKEYKVPPNVISLQLTSWQKIYTVVTAKLTIENGDESKSLTQLVCSKYRIFEVRVRLNDFINEHYWTCSGLIFEALTENLGLELQRIFRLNMELSQNC